MLNNLEKTALGFYDLAWSTAIPFLSKNRRLADGFAQRKLDRRLPEADIWIQAASAGEAYLVQSILKMIEPPGPVHILVTSNTRQGLDIIRAAILDISNKTNITLSAAFFPFDSPHIMRQAVKQVSPDIMVLLESELWPGLLAALKESGSKILTINGRMTLKSLKHYQIWTSFWKRLAPDRILAVSHDDANRFGILFGKERVRVVPNIKFDGINAENAQGKALESIKRFLPSEIPFLVLASIRKEEEALILKMIKTILEKHPKTVIGLFPRHMHRLSHLEKKLAASSLCWKLRSQTTHIAPPGTVLLWDKFGELSTSYHLAKAAFVGGSLVDSGGQNFLEPLMCGIIPVTGPYWDNFYWVGRQIMDIGLVRMAGDWKDATAILIQMLQKPESREKVRKKALDYIGKRRGSTRKACRLICQYIPA